MRNVDHASLRTTVVAFLASEMTMIHMEVRDHKEGRLLPWFLNPDYRSVYLDPILFSKLPSPSSATQVRGFAVFSLTMATLSTAIHTVSICVACLSVTILGLVSHSVLLKNQLEYAAPPDLKGTGMSFLFWPACGGIVDCCLFLVLWIKTPFRDSRVSIAYTTR